MAVQINVAANQAALTASIQAGVQAYNQRFAQNNQINLSVNQRAFSQPLGRMTGDVKDFEAALAASNARVIAFGASTAVLGGVIRSFKELANVTIDVEKNLADINRVFGLTTSQLQKFSTDLFSVGKQTASTFDDASKAALEFSRQGLKAEEVLLRTKDALTLARVAGISTANSVDALTSTVNGFAATGVTTTQILNKLVAVEQDFAVGAGDLAEALSRTGQAAQEAGVSLDQLNALVTAAQQSTARGGAVIGNALKTIFTRLQRTETLDQLEAFNIAVRDVQGNTLPAVTVLQNFAGAYKNLGDAQRAQLSEQVAGVYQVNILKAIVGDLNKSQGVYAGALQRGASATNEAEVATAKLNQTLDALLKQTATSTQQLANNIGKVTFEPLARYGTEQLKSLVESMNEILEGEGVGSTFANGLLKGIRNVIAGPGAIAAFFTLFKLIQNSFTYLAQALPQIAGITTETQNRKNIEQSILQIMQQQGPVSQALAGSMGNQAAQAQLLLQLARQQTAEYQIQSTLAKQLATQLAGQGVRVKGSGGLQVTRAGGYIPAATRMAETVGAQAGGYAPGKVVKSPVGGVMNTAEDVKYVPGFAQPFINPPAGSKAGRTHRQNAISRTGVDPYTAGGFIPNFAKKSIRSLGQQSLNNLYDVGDRVGNTTIYDKYDDQGLIKTFNLPFTYEEYRLKAADAYDNASKIYKTEGVNGGLANANKYLKEATGGYSQALEKKYFDEPDTSPAKKHLNKIAGGFGEKDTAEIFNKHTKLINAVGPDFKKIIKNRVSFIETKVRKNDVPDEVLLEKFLRGYAKTSLPVSFKGNHNEDVISAKFGTLIHAIAAKTPDTKSLGFIPNFAIPMEAGRIPWFKKYSTSLKNTSGDKDVFRQKDFPTFGNGLDHFYATNGNNDMVGSLYEKFILSAMNIARNSSVFKTTEELGLKKFPVTDLGNTAAFDLGEDMGSGGLIGIQAKAGSKNNQTSGGGVNKTLTSNIKRFGDQNPSRIKDLKKAVLIYNDPRYHDPTGKNPAGVLSPFEQAISGIVKPDYSSVDEALKPKLTKVTDDLLSYYEKNKNTKNAKSLFDGFIPNFGNNIDATSSSMRKALGLMPFLVDLKRKTYAEADMFHYQIANSKFIDPETGKSVYGSLSDKDMHGSTYQDTFVRGFYNASLGKAEFELTKAQKEDKNFMPKHSALLEKVKARYAERFKSAVPVKAKRVSPLAAFRNEGFIPNFADLIDVDTLSQNSVHYSGDLMKLIKDIESSVGRHLTSGELRLLTNPKTNLSKLNDPKVLNRFINSERKGGFAGFAKGFTPNFASRREMLKDLVKFNLESTPDIKDKNVFGSKTTLFRGVRNKGARYSGKFGRDIFEQSRNYSTTENDIDYFRDTDINKIANDHIKEKKLLPFLSASTDEDIAKYFARGREDSGFSDEGKVGSKTINNSRIFSAESIRKFTKKYGQKALKQLMMEHSTWGTFGLGKGVAMNFESFSDKRGFEGTDFAKEISFLSNGFIPNFNSIKGRNSFQKNWLIETAKKRNLNLNDPNVFSKLGAEFAKTYPNDQGMFGLSEGFIPNFAYKQAVMGLEESMSGNKAVFDTKPFPHIRNKSQPTFSSAISDHGGLSNALSDSMRGQKNAGLMNGGFMPNFGTVNPNAAFGVGGLGALTQAETLQFNKLNAALSKLETDTTLTASQMKALKTSIRLEARSLSASTGIIDIVTETNKALAVSIRQNITAQRASTSANAPTPSLAQRLLGARGERADKFAGSKLGGIAGVVGGALIGGQLESFIQGGRDRSQLSAAEKFASSASSGVLTATTTGAEIGSMIPGLGTAAGAAIGALIGLGKAAYDSQESLQDLQKSSEFYKTQVDNIISSSGSYIQQLKELSSISDPSLLNQASFKLSETFQNLSKESPELGRKFMEAGGDIDKMGKAIEDFTSTANMVKSINNLKTSYKESGDKLSFTIPVRSNQLAKKGYNIQQGSGAIKETEASLQTSFVQFQGFFDLLKKGGLTAENSSAFMEEFQKEMQGYTSESDLAAIAKKYNISETIAKELADLSDNVIDEMGVEGDFFVANSGVLVKRFFDATNDKYKSAAQQLEKQAFNARPIIKRIEDSISNYVFNIASQLQNMEFESSRFKILENAANNYLDSISTPLEKASREISSRNRETQTKTEASRMKFISDFEQNIGSKLPKTLGGSDAGALGKLEKLIESFKTSSPEQQLSQINELIKNTNSVEATTAAGYKNVDPNEVKSLNAELKKERDSLMLLIQTKKENLSLSALENDVAKRKAESTERLLILQNKLIESDTKRAISIAGQKANIDIRENDLQNTRKTPGFGFGVSEGRINRETIMQNRGLMMERQSLTRADTLGNVKSQLKSTLFPILTPIKTAFQEIEKVSISEQPNLYKNLGVDKVNISDMTDLFNLDDMLDKINDPASLESFRKNLEYIFSNIDQTSVLYKPLQEQMGIISQTLIGLDKESKIFESNSQADIKIADVNDRINNAYIYRLNTLLQIEKAQRGILNTIEIEEQRLDAAKSRPANFFGLGVTGKAEKQIGFDEQNLALRQRRQNAQATQNVQQQLSQFETFRNKVQAEKINPLVQDGFVGPSTEDQLGKIEKARTAISNLDTSKIANVDQAKAFVLELSNIRNQYGLQGEAAKTLADTEKEINSILNSNVDELDKMRSIQDILNSKVRQEAKDRQSIRIGFKEGFDQIQDDADTGLNRLAKDTPMLFRDGMVDAIKATIRETDNLDAALMGVASKFLDTFSTQLMNTGISKIISGSGLGSIFGAQTGGYIRAQSGMYISGTGTGDKYPAMLENGEYVLNRRAVMAMGGPAALDTLNFSAAPRFASGGTFKKEFNDISSMENNMTQMGLENDPYYNELNDAAKQKAAEDRAKKLEAKKQKAAMIGSLVAAAATIAIGAGISNVASNMKATNAQKLSAKVQATGGTGMTNSEMGKLASYQKSGLLGKNFEYTGGAPQTGFRSLTSKPFYSSNIYGANPYAPAFKKNGRQTGGLIGSRLSDTIPGYMEGGLYDSPMVKRYGTGMQSGGSPISSVGNSNSTVNNNTSANNSFNFNTSVQRDGSLKMGSNTTSYEQQDVELSKNLNNKIYAAVGEVIRKEKQFGGSLAGARNS